LIGR
jgi:RNase P protein component